MLKQLLRLANLLDKEGFQVIADEVDALIKSAIPRSDEEIDKSVDEYFNNPEIQERNAIEAKYLNEEQMLEPTPFLGYEYNYEGFPDWFAEDARPVERYHTVIASEKDTNSMMDYVFQDDGTWELMGRQGNGDGMVQAVYHFKSLKDSEREKERAEFKPEIEKMLAEPDDVEVTEAPEDVIEVEEPKKQHGGGVKLF